jgi:hypothetical protein
MCLLGCLEGLLRGKWHGGMEFDFYLSFLTATRYARLLILCSFIVACHFYFQVRYITLIVSNLLASLPVWRTQPATRAPRSHPLPRDSLVCIWIVCNLWRICVRPVPCRWCSWQNDNGKCLGRQGELSVGKFWDRTPFFKDVNYISDAKIIMDSCISVKPGKLTNGKTMQKHLFWMVSFGNAYSIIQLMMNDDAGHPGITLCTCGFGIPHTLFVVPPRLTFWWAICHTGLARPDRF